ncbi:enoyl-CoA hydratase-related protein [Nocardia sp. NPDC004860]|uniref:enoyl-CoA hydratase/isomerase family protein n=1 Tax=Nocardia sp. NPDC004860 TaxID=3154557 RepID=UPI0033B5462D
MTQTVGGPDTAVLANYEPPQLETLTLDIHPGRIAVLTVNRPERMNSQTVTMFGEFGIAAHALRDTDARALIIRGAGDRAFCTGFDLDEISVLTRMGAREFLQFLELSAGGMAAIRHLPFPVIAAVNGAAAGGGLSLSLAADFRLIAPHAKFNAAFVRVGLSVGELSNSWQLTRLIGYGRAAELSFTGRVVGAEEAVRIGLANRIVAADRLMDEAFAVAHAIAEHSLGEVRMAKRALQRNQEVGSFSAALELERRGRALLAFAGEADTR